MRQLVHLVDENEEWLRTLSATAGRKNAMGMGLIRALHEWSRHFLRFQRWDGSNFGNLMKARFCADAVLRARTSLVVPGNRRRAATGEAVHGSVTFNAPAVPGFFQTLVERMPADGTDQIVRDVVREMERVRGLLAELQQGEDSAQVEAQLSSARQQNAALQGHLDQLETALRAERVRETEMAREWQRIAAELAALSQLFGEQLRELQRLQEESAKQHTAAVQAVRVYAQQTDFDPDELVRLSQAIAARKTAKDQAAAALRESPSARFLEQCTELERCLHALKPSSPVDPQMPPAALPPVDPESRLTSLSGGIDALHSCTSSIAGTAGRRDAVMILYRSSVQECARLTELLHSRQEQAEQARRLTVRLRTLQQTYHALVSTRAAALRILHENA